MVNLAKPFYYTPAGFADSAVFIDQSESDIQYRQNEYLKLREMSQYGHTQMCLQRYILRYFGEDGPDCGRCSNCLDEREQVDITVETQKCCPV